VVYHGTVLDKGQEPFSEFKIGELGIHFGNLEQATGRANRLEVFRKAGVDIRPYMYEVYLKIENPIYSDSDTRDWSDNDELERVLHKSGSISNDEAKSIGWNMDQDYIRQELIDFGYDGVKYKNSFEGKGDSYIVFSNDQIKSATDNNGDFDPNDPNIHFKKAPKVREASPEGLAPLMVSGKKERFVETVQDIGLSAKNMQTEILRRKGVVPMAANVYEAENRMHSAMMHQVRKFEGIIMDELNTTVADIIMSHDSNLKELQRYLKAKSSIERNDNEGISAISDDDTAPWGRAAVEQIIKDFEQKVPANEIAKLWIDIKAANDFTITRLYEGHLISRANYKEMKARNYYVPLKSWDFTDKVNPMDYFDYVDADRSAYQGLHKAGGRISEADDPLAYIQSQAHSAVLQSGKNMMAYKALTLARLNKGMDDLISVRKIWTMTKGTDANGNAIYKDVVKDGDKAYSVDGFDRKGNMILVDEGDFQELYDAKVVTAKYNRSNTSQRPNYLATQHLVEVWENGEKYLVSFGDPKVANFINANNQLWPELTYKLKGTIGVVNRLISANFTAKNPAFIPINWIRDFGYAATAHAIKKDGDLRAFLKLYGPALAAINRYQTGKANPKNNHWDSLYESFMSYGGETGYIHLQEIDKIKKNLEREINRKQGIRNGWDKVSQNKAMKAAGNALNYAALMSENSARFATFLASVQNGKSMEQSATDAKNITVNFNRKGRISGLVGSLYAFFNATIQGGDSLISMYSNNKSRFNIAAASFVTAGMVLTEILRGLSPLDDDGKSVYDKIPDWVKETCMIIPFFGDGYLTIPLPQGFRALYALGVIGSDMLHGQKSAGEGLWKAGENIANAFSPFAIDNMEFKQGEMPWRATIPTPFVPMYDIIKNEDFTGQPVFYVPFTKDMDKYTPEAGKGSYNVNSMVKAGAKALNRLGGGDDSRQAGYHVNRDGDIEYQGWRDLIFNQNPSKWEHAIMYYLGGRGRFFNDIYKTADKALDPKEDIHSYNIPIVKRLYMTPYTGNNWDAYHEIEEDVRTYNHYLKQANKDGDREMYDRLVHNREMRRVAKVYKVYNERIKEYSERIKFESDPVKLKLLKDKREDYINKFIKKIETIKDTKEQ